MNSKNNAQDLAILGGTPIIDTQLPVGQLYFPSWEHYKEAMRGIFERQYYTNHGPLAQELEAKLADFFGVKHVITVVNATLGLMMAVKALGLQGRIIVPAFTFIASAQSLTWTGIEPIFCDADPSTYQMSLPHIEQLLNEIKGVSAILGVNLWGGSCNPKALEDIASQYGISLYFDSAHAFGCSSHGIPIGNFGSMEVFSFHATKVFGTAEGGCITTNDDILAARLRNIRSSYGAGPIVDVPLTSNGRFSEAQAAIGLLNLEQFDEAIAHNQNSFLQYHALIDKVPGIRVLDPQGVDKTNYQYLLCEVDEEQFGLSRDGLLAVLKEENINARRYFYPGIHRCVPYVDEFAELTGALPETDRLCSRLIQLPIGAMVSPDKINLIGEVIAAAHTHAAELRSHLRNQA